MTKTMKKITVIILCFPALFLFQPGFGQVRLPRLISDGMVLLRKADVHVWGWANAGEEITVGFIGQNYQTSADNQGNWSVTLSDLKVGGPYDMEIIGSNQIILKNILVGDVWTCSGQSNMVLPMKRVRELYEKEIAQSENPYIRYFFVRMKYDFNVLQNDLIFGEWKSANPENVLDFGAVAYFFAKALYEKYAIPIGLINASVGGTPAEAWMSQDALKAFPAYLEIAERYKDDAYIDQILKEDRTIRDNWYRELRRLDRGFADKGKPWFDPALDTSSWSALPVPSFWADHGLGNVNGVVWFRKEIEVPASMTQKPGLLRMGTIVDADSVYINGQFLGTTSYQYPPRKYPIPENLLRPGKNTIVVRVINNRGKGGFVKDKPYQLTVGGQTIDLKGEWQYKLGAVMDPLPDQFFISYKPSGLFNGMVAPLLHNPIKGVIWYQGESNAGRPAEYRELFPALISDWRKHWHQGDFPFLFVQLPNFMKADDQPSESSWAEMREAQLKTLSVPNTGMAVTIDVGEWNDIHPLNKKPVGERLALIAQKLVYHDEQVVYSGPIYRSMQIEGKQIILTFTNTGSGLAVKGGGDLKQFAIAGADKKFVWAKAKIADNRVVVWNDRIKNPIAVRYAWADNPEGANLINKEGLPASPFRTDE
jgi:sialate O-acetylesterase